LELFFAISISLHSIEIRRETPDPRNIDSREGPVIKIENTPVPILPYDDFDIVLPQEQKDQKSVYGKLLH